MKRVVGLPLSRRAVLLLLVCLLWIAVAIADPSSPASDLGSTTSNQAYEEALILLRSLIKTKPLRPKSTAKVASSSTSKHRSSHTVQTPVPSPTSSSLLWELVWSWTPLGTILRVFTAVSRLVFDNLGFSAIVFPSEVIPTATRSTAAEAKKWLGPPIGATRHELRWQGARPLTLWPDWERLGDGLVSQSPEDGPWDTVVFGPFYGEPAPPSSLRLSASVLDRLPTSLRRLVPDQQGKEESAQREIEQKRARAVELLEWSAWGRIGVDWEWEAHAPAARNQAQLLQDIFADNRTSESASADALWVLAEHSLWGTHGSTPNMARARACYQRLVDHGIDQYGNSAAGNASAHARLAFLEGSGWESTTRGEWAPLSAPPHSNSPAQVRSAWRERRKAFAQLKRDDGMRQAKALLHYTYAAEAGHTPSQMALGFRYKAGVGVKPSCWTALKWYEMAANDAYQRFQQGPPGGLTLPYTKLRLSDLDGGAYGLGASVASTGYAAMKPSVRAALSGQPGSAGDPAALQDMLEYHIYHAEHGDVRGMLTLARVYYHGSIYGAGDSSGAVRRDYKKALDYLFRITREVWPKDADVVGRGGATGWTAKEGDKSHDTQLKVDDGLTVQAGTAAGMIGRMYLRGEGVAQDFVRAWTWFSRGQDTGDAESYNGLGIMLRDGLGTQRDVSSAVSYFEAAGKAGHGEANAHLAKVHLDMDDVKSAMKHVQLAIQGANMFEAYYLMSRMNAKQARAEGSAERCRAAVAGYKLIVERGDWSAPYSHKAERAWRRGKTDKALLGWALAGEMGFEASQNNVAYVLDRDKHRLRLAVLDASQDNSTDRLALIHWTRSAAQDNVDAMVKMGDYYFHGIGTGNPGQPAYQKAAACYSAAADRQVSALAYWNMGWMYEKGIGVARQDFHLAKRYYDMAVEVNAEAYLPVTLSLVKLHVRALWAALFRSESSASAISLFSSYTSSDSSSAAYTEAEETELSRRRTAQERHLMDTSLEQQDNVGGGGLGDPNDPDTWSPRGDESDEELDNLIESGLLILALAGLAYLAYMRQRVQLRLQRERREAAAAPNGDHPPAQQHPWQPWPDNAANHIVGV